jgi:hypothetical protein
MGKLASKHVELAKQILETEDEVVLDAVDQLLNGGVHYQFSEAEISEFQDRLARYEADPTHETSWADVKKRIRGKLKS